MADSETMGIESVKVMNTLLKQADSTNIATRSTLPSSDLKDLSASLILKNRTYQQQYANVYFVRLMQLRKAVMQAAVSKFPGVRHVERVLDVQQGQPCFVIGTLYLEMPLKPNILDDITKEHWIAAAPPKSSYYSDADQVMLEDESGRIRTTGSALHKQDLFTGIVVAIKGRENANGDFEVDDMCFAGLPDQSLRSLDVQSNGEYLALTSGLNVGDNAHDDLYLQLLAEYLTGQLGDDKDHLFSGRITRLIVAGNSISPPKTSDLSKASRKYNADSNPYDPKPMQTFDELLADICTTLPVDLMPGEKDPANATMPQQAMHLSMFVRACRYSTLSTLTNPSWQQQGDAIILGSSGQPINDMAKYVAIKDPLELLEKTLLWRHMAPTTPDTLWSFPFRDTDPFILSTCPHLYFAGNQTHFDTKSISGDKGQQVRLVLVPSFQETRTIVLVNLTTLHCHPVRIEA